MPEGSFNYRRLIKRSNQQPVSPGVGVKLESLTSFHLGRVYLPRHQRKDMSEVPTVLVMIIINAHNQDRRMITQIQLFQCWPKSPSYEADIPKPTKDGR